MGKQKDIDWDALYKEYCLDQLSDRQLAKKYGTSHTTIGRRATKEGWVKDKGEEVRRKTRAALISEEQTDNSAPANAPSCTSGALVVRTTPTPEDVDRAVTTNVTLVREHRKDIRNGRLLVELLSSQLHETALNRAEIEEDILIETETDDGINYRRRNTMLKAVSLPQNASTLRDLTTALKNLIPLERQAFNLDKHDPGDASDLISGEIVFKGVKSGN